MKKLRFDCISITKNYYEIRLKLCQSCSKLRRGQLKRKRTETESLFAMSKRMLYKNQKKLLFTRTFFDFTWKKYFKARFLKILGKKVKNYHINFRNFEIFVSDDFILLKYGINSLPEINEIYNSFEERFWKINMIVPKNWEGKM